MHFHAGDAVVVHRGVDGHRALREHLRGRHAQSAFCAIFGHRALRENLRGRLLKNREKIRKINKKRVFSVLLVKNHET